MSAKINAVIVAGGTGSRMGNEIPKQFLELNGKPLLLYTLEAFLFALPQIKIVLVVHPDHLQKANNIAKLLPAFPKIVQGASTRFGSVKAGLQWVDDDAMVLIHDAVRCLVSEQLIHSCLENARVNGNAIPAIFPRESTRLVQGEMSKIIDRNQLRLVQTPQTFQAKQIKSAYDAADALANFTDDASVLEAAGVPIHLIAGEESNIKITWPIDLYVAEAVIRQRNELR